MITFHLRNRLLDFEGYFSINLLKNEWLLLNKFVLLIFVESLKKRFPNAKEIVIEIDNKKKIQFNGKRIKSY